VITGLRGALGASLEVSGPRRDLHAGSFGGAVVNPAEVLARLVRSLHDQAGRVAVPGFYDQVLPLVSRERRQLATMGPSDRVMLAPAGTWLGHGEPGFSAFERATRRPAVIVTDLRTSGRGRTVIPAWAAADLNVRLAAGQEPRPIAGLLRRHVQTCTPPGVHARLIVRSSTPPYTLDQRALVLNAVRSACRSVFGREPVMLPSGGSIPFVSALAATRGIDVALFGFGLPGDASAWAICSAEPKPASSCTASWPITSWLVRG
jgi:acetylornithine deacetylase/succinyl-diaminopimelate desuccinylase-like protein